MDEKLISQLLCRIRRGPKALREMPLASVISQGNVGPIDLRKCFVLADGQLRRGLDVSTLQYARQAISVYDSNMVHQALAAQSVRADVLGIHALYADLVADCGLVEDIIHVVSRNLSVDRALRGFCQSAIDCASHGLLDERNHDHLTIFPGNARAAACYVALAGFLENSGRLPSRSEMASTELTMALPTILIPINPVLRDLHELWRPAIKAREVDYYGERARGLQLRRAEFHRLTHSIGGAPWLGTRLQDPLVRDTEAFKTEIQRMLKQYRPNLNLSGRTAPSNRPLAPSMEEFRL